MKLVLRAAETVGQDAIFVSLEDGPAMTQHAGKLVPLSCAAAELLAPLRDHAREGETVKEVGGRLLASLREHPAIAHSLRTLLDDPAPCPIYVRLMTPATAEYPWETLFDSEHERFLALEDRWPITRIADSSADDLQVRHYAPPLRLLAVLSAVKIDAAEEWRSLWTALTSTALDVRVHVIVGQHTVRDEIEALEDARITCEILESKDQLRTSMRNANADIVHVFCHGRMAPTPMLLLGTSQDHARENSSIWLDPSALTGLAPRAWLMTLSCCDGANTSDVPGVRALAHQLVSSAGYPAVVGMREPISQEDAALFTSVFYRSLIGKLGSELARSGEIEIDIAAVLNAPRQALRDKFVPDDEPGAAAAMHREWTYPSLYIRPAPLKLIAETRRPTEDQYQRDYLIAKLDALEGIRLGLHDGTPSDVIERIETELAEIRRKIEED